MLTHSLVPKDIDAYIAMQPTSIRIVLKKLRETILQAAPKAEEVISYRMPAFKYNGMLVYFAVYKNHIGFYPMPASIKAFKKELSAYKTSKGAIQFPIDQPIPFGLVSKIVKFRVKENIAKAKLKSALIEKK